MNFSNFESNCKGDHPTARDQCGESQRRSPLTSDPVSPPPPPGRLYPNIVPPGTVQQSEKSFLFEVHKRLDNDPLPPQQQQQQQQQQQLQQQQLQQQQLQQQQQQQQQQHAGPAGRAGEGVGVRYLVHGLPQTQQFHAVHAVPSGSVNNAGVFFYISSSPAPLSSFPNGVQRISGIFVPYRRRLSYASVTLFAAFAVIIMLFFFKMHADLSQKYDLTRPREFPSQSFTQSEIPLPPGGKSRRAEREGWTNSKATVWTTTAATTMVNAEQKWLQSASNGTKETNIDTKNPSGAI